MINEHFSNIVEGGYCIGCGACASIESASIQIAPDEFGRLQPAIVGRHTTSGSQIRVTDVCPFSDEVLSEDAIGHHLFHSWSKHNEYLGYYMDAYAGYVLEDDYREIGSAGGMGTWLATELLSQGLVDHVIHVRPCAFGDSDNRLFRYEISTSVGELRAGHKARYYPVEMSQVVHRVRSSAGRFAFVGLPCMIKAMRLLMMHDNVLRDRITFCIGLVCGHLKSMRFAESLAWQLGVKPNELVSIDFRRKLEHRAANRYGINIVGTVDGENIEKTVAADTLFGSAWSLGFFKYKACDYCDDVVAELADVSLGDAWLPRYMNDSGGTNLIIVRHPAIRELIKQAASQRRLKLDLLSAEEVYASQAGGFRHRREGLAYRLHVADTSGTWRPRRRVHAGEGILTERNKKIQDMRVALVERSHVAFREALLADDYSVFEGKMKEMVEAYQMLSRLPIWERVGSRARQVVIGRRLIEHYHSVRRD